MRLHHFIPRAVVAWAKAAALCSALMLSVTTQGAASGQPFPFGHEGWTDLAQSLRVNGLPLQVRVRHTTQSPDEVEALFRQHWGEPLLRKVGSESVSLSRYVGTEHFVTAQIFQTGSGAKVLVSRVNTRDLTAAKPVHWNRMPSGSSLMTDTESVDGLRSSRYVVYANRLAIKANRDYLVNQLAERGLALQTEQAGQRKARISLVLLFAGPSGHEATAAISQTGNRVVTALNVTTVLAEAR